MRRKLLNFICDTPDALLALLLAGTYICGAALCELFVALQLGKPWWLGAILGMSTLIGSVLLMGVLAGAMLCVILFVERRLCIKGGRDE